MQKQPRTLTINVAKGKVKGSSFPIYTEAKKRNILPVAPPAPTNNICFINILSKLKYYLYIQLKFSFIVYMNYNLSLSTLLTYNQDH